MFATLVGTSVFPESPKLGSIWPSAVSRVTARYAREPTTDLGAEEPARMSFPSGSICTSRRSAAVHELRIVNRAVLLEEQLGQFV